MSSFAEMKDRKLVQWGLAYLAGAWLLLQLAQLLAEAYGWPPFVMRAVPLLLVVGFFAALILAWYHGEKGEQRIGAIELLMLTGIFILAGGVLALVNARNDVGAAEAAGRDVAVAASTLAALAVPEQGSIAVLPFVDMSAAGDQEYFADGLAEELLNALSQLPELRVAARTSSFSFKDTNVPVDSIAEVLNVRHVLEGSVRKAKNHVRITAQLIDAETGYHDWSQTYDADLANIFAVQDSISRSIVAALRIELDTKREEPLVLEETAVPEAHTLLLRGEYAQRGQDVEEAERFFRKALTLDPEYARAHAALAQAIWFQAYNGVSSEEAYAAAEREAERALALDPGQAAAHVVLAEIMSNRDWNWEAADRHFAEAVQANPGYAATYNWRAFFLILLGRTEEAIASARRAVALNPVSTGPVNNLGEIYRYAGQSEAALEQYRRVLEFPSGHVAAFNNIALTQSVAGDDDAAIQAAKKAVEGSPTGQWSLSTLAYVQARAGRHTEAERTLAALRKLPEVSPVLLATVYAGLGDADRLFTLVERAADERNGYVIYLGVDPVFDPYRDDPRMRRLLDRMGLP